MFYKIQINVWLTCLMLVYALVLLPHGASVAEIYSAGPDDMIERLMREEPHRRGAAALELAGEGRRAVLPVTDVVERYYEYDDMHFISACISVLARIGPEARQATDALLAALDAPSKKVTYMAARALGSIWEGAGRAEAAAVREINTMLLSYAVVADDAEKYGPALALARINDIPVRDSPNQHPQSLDPRELTGQVYAWFARSPDRLAAMEEWPWPLLIQSYLRAPDSGEGGRAFGLLMGHAPLESVGFLMQRLRQTDPHSDIWEVMADLIGRLTGVELDVADARERADMHEALDQWLNRWLEALKTRKDERHRRHAWRTLERFIHAARFKAYPEDFDRLERIKGVIIYQYDSTEHIPQNASRISVSLLEDYLALKKQFSEAGDELLRSEDPNVRLRTVQNILDMLQQRKGREIGLLFLDEFVEIALAEENARVLDDFSQVLTTIGGIPIRLEEQMPADERRQMLDGWMTGVRELKG